MVVVLVERIRWKLFWFYKNSPAAKTPNTLGFKSKNTPPTHNWNSLKLTYSTW